MKKRIFAMIIVILIISIFVFPPILWKIYNADRAFTPVKWEKCEVSKRFRMIHSLQEQYELVGMDKDEIIQLLGEPSMKSENAYEYKIRDDMFGMPKVFALFFKEEKVYKVCIRDEDW